MSETLFFEQQDGTKIAYKILKSENAKIIVFDNRGMGESTVASYSDPITIDLMAQDTIALIKYIGIKRFSLFGTNMGARVAFTVALNLPSDLKLEKLVVSSCSPREDMTTPVHQKVNKYYEVSSNPFPDNIQGIKERLLKSEFDKDLAKYLLKHPDVLDKIAEIMFSKIHNRPFEMMRRQWEAIKACDLLPRLKEIKVPTFIIHAENEFSFTIKDAELLDQELPNSKLYHIPNMGHNIFVMEVETTTKAIFEFLNN
ncbi:23841_t:CDS:2 [Dentiscutata erythropus]|uniref:23841_t:CDS:1 n=1 Tax=Dentiscutata erythropus TaxID=1348616 RepID=A0A9N9IEY5_9GLOM|nr:23841_t:CDS:2 [Dentiscutata erythropus]